jgi:hypothetical protein
MFCGGRRSMVRDRRGSMVKCLNLNG